MSTLEHPEQPAQLYRNIINETTLWAQIRFPPPEGRGSTGRFGTLDPWRALFLVEGPTLYVFKDILAALPQPLTNKQTLPPPLTQMATLGTA